MFAGRPPLWAAVVLVCCAPLHETPCGRTEAGTYGVGGGVSYKLLDGALNLAVGAGVGRDGHEAKVGARAHLFFESLDDEIFAMALPR